MNNIVLISPSSDWGRMKRIREASPPLGLLSLAAFLEKMGHGVDVIDLAVQPEALDLLAPEKDKPLVVGLTGTTNTINSSLAIAGIIKNRFDQALIVIGGPHATVVPGDVLQSDYVDCVVTGEGEVAFNRLCEAVLGDSDWRQIDGIAFRDNDNVVVNPSTDYIKDMDTLPFAARHLVPMHKYSATPINYKRWPSTPVITTRGCPFKCTFCSNPVHGKTVRFRSPENIIEELILLKGKYKIKDVVFWDDTFTVNKKRVEKICELLIEQNLNLTWSCATRVDTINPELLTILKQAGCWQVSFGVESGVDRLRQKIEKGISKEQISQAFENCRKAGIQTRAFFMLGIPAETQEESEQTIEFAKELNPDFVQFTLTTPYPGCELYNEAISNGWKPPRWEKFQTYPEDEPVYVTPGRSGKELMATQARAFKSFYLRFGYIFSRLVRIRSFGEFTKYVQVFFNLVRWR